MLYRRLRYRKFIAHRARFNVPFKAFIAMRTARTHDFKWHNKVGGKRRHSECGGMRRELQKRVDLIAEPRGPTAGHCLISVISVRQLKAHTRARNNCTELPHARSPAKRKIEFTEFHRACSIGASETFKYSSSAVRG